MKKLFYIVLLVVVLMVVAHLVKNYNTNKVIAEDTVTVSIDENGNVITEEDIVIPGEDSDAVDSVVEEVEEDIVEENPDATADDGETVINE